jgi:hypothetical protein
MLLHEELPAAEAAVPAGPAEAVAPTVAGDLKSGVFFGFLAVVLVALIGAIVLYAIGKDAAAQVILPVGTGLLGLLTGTYLGESSSKS